MPSKRSIRWFLAVAAVISMASSAIWLLCGQDEGPGRGHVEITPIPRMGLSHDLGRAAIGEKVFESQWIGASRKRSCGACHRYEMGGVDFRRHGLKPNEGAYTRSTVNSALAKRYYADGSSSDLKEVVERMVAGREFSDGGSADDAADRIRRYDNGLAQRFNAVYGCEIAGTNVVDALVHHLRASVSESARFDYFLEGDESALTEEERRGMEIFMRQGCASCHGGPNMGEVADGGGSAGGRNPRGLRGLFMRGDAYRKYSEMPRSPSDEGECQAIESFLKAL